MADCACEGAGGGGGGGGMPNRPPCTVGRDAGPNNLAASLGKCCGSPKPNPLTGF